MEYVISASSTVLPSMERKAAIVSALLEAIFLSVPKLKQVSFLSYLTLSV